MSEQNADRSCSLSPTDWLFKGEGNANIVYEYRGGLQHLAGNVLKVRKSNPNLSPGADSHLEDAVWGPVLGQCTGSNPLGRELLYIQRCLVPLLGAEHVPPQEPVEVTSQFLLELSSRSTNAAGHDGNSLEASAPAAVLMPDMTLFPPIAPRRNGSPNKLTSGGSGSMGGSHGAAGRDGCPMGALQQQQWQPLQQATAEPTAAAAAAAAAAPEQPPLVPTLPSAGAVVEEAATPALCVELKPKCGFLPTCASVHPANRIKHSKSRYQLHQLLKLSDGRVATPSTYDPLDLFSGDITCMLAALRALLDHPQNNLKFFWDGRPVGVRQGIRLWQNSVRGSNRGGIGSLEAEDSHGAAAAAGGDRMLENGLASELAGEAAAAAAAGERGSEQGEEHLLTLLMQILKLEGVLNRLLEAQQQCEYDIEGVYALYCKLKAECGSGQGDAAGQAAGNAGQQQEQQLCRDVGSEAQCRSLVRDSAQEGDSCCMEVPPCRNSSSSGAVECNLSCAACEWSSHAAEVQRLQALPHNEACAVLRRYVVAATAKDCALMIALQRLPPWAAPASPPEQPEGHQQAQQPLEFKVVQHAGTGEWFRYRVAFVDLDMKPIAKIPHHYELDQRILAAALRHNGSDKSFHADQ